MGMGNVPDWQSESDEFRYEDYVYQIDWTKIFMTVGKAEINYFKPPLVEQLDVDGFLTCATLLKMPLNGDCQLAQVTLNEITPTLGIVKSKITLTCTHLHIRTTVVSGRKLCFWPCALRRNINSSLFKVEDGHTFLLYDRIQGFSSTNIVEPYGPMRIPVARTELRFNMLAAGGFAHDELCVSAFPAHQEFSRSGVASAMEQQFATTFGIPIYQDLFNELEDEDRIYSEGTEAEPDARSRSAPYVCKIRAIMDNVIQLSDLNYCV